MSDARDINSQLTAIAHIATCVPDEDEEVIGDHDDEDGLPEAHKSATTPFEFDNSSESEVPATPPKPGSVPPRAVFVVSPIAPPPQQHLMDNDAAAVNDAADQGDVVAPQTVIKMRPPGNHREPETGVFPCCNVLGHDRCCYLVSMYAS